MNRLNKYGIILLLSIIAGTSCKKDEEEYIPNIETDFLSYDIVGIEADADINDFTYSITLSFPEDVVKAENLVADFLLSKGATAMIDEVVQLSGHSRNDFEKPLSYVVWAEDEFNNTQWEVIPINNSYTLSWGLGGFQKSTLSNDRDYEWYLDQVNTGEHARNNCGPTVTTMAAKWYMADFSFTPEDARNAYRSEGGWWYTDDIDAYLTDKDIPHYFIDLGNNVAGTEEIITDELEKGNIVLICLDMYYIPRESNAQWRVDKFYYTNGKDWGHFILAKGHKLVDGKVFLEIYDPNSLNRKYSDGSLKGKDRYYRSSDIYNATSIWWNYAIVITESEAKKSASEYLDPSEIEHRWGR